MSDGQDWKPQSFNFAKGGAAANQPHKVGETEANRTLQAGGSVSVSKKEHQTSNSQGGGIGAAAKRLDDDNEGTKVKKIDFGVKINIQKGRQAKDLTQQQLAHLINEKPSVVADYENGRGVPNESVLQRMEKALGIYLRGAKAGQEMQHKIHKADK